MRIKTRMEVSTPTPPTRKRQEEDPLFQSRELRGYSRLSRRSLFQCCKSEQGEAFPTEGCGAPSFQPGRQQPPFPRTEVEKLQTEWEDFTSDEELGDREQPPPEGLEGISV